MLQPPNLAALQKIQLENLQKLQELEGGGKFTPHKGAEPEPERGYQATLDLMDKIPELMLKSPEIFHKLPELLQRLPTERLPKTDDKNAEGDTGPMDLSNDRTESRAYENEDIWSRYLRPFSANEPCLDGSGCEDAGKDHFHCTVDGCRIVFR